ncbi:MAG: hypothetical protein ACR2OO_03445 [Thermomicrobiales bacterium]
MPQATDIVLDGAGYMVLPGSYSRRANVEPDGRVGRWVQRDFVGGQRRAMQLERDAGWDSPAVGPALRGQGVEPWPFTVGNTDSAILATPSTTTKPRSCVVGSLVYIGIGRYLYKSVALSAAGWANLTMVADMGVGNAISALTPYLGTKVAICCGGSKDIQLWDGAALSVFSAGERGSFAIGYANRLVWADALVGGDGQLKMSTGAGIDTRQLDGPIVNMGLHGGKICIATRSSIWLLGGKGDAVAAKWTSDPEPVFTHGTYTDDEDYCFLASYGGRLYTWLTGKVMEWNPNTGSSRQGWRETGVEGKDCYGGTVCADRLVTPVRNRQGAVELWAFDGTGRWMMTTGATTRIWPCHLAGAGNYDALLFRSGSATYDLYRMVYRDAANHNLANTGVIAYKSSLIDAGERDKPKAWRKIGASFATAEDRGNTASVDTVTCTLGYSVDGGRTFTTLGSISPNDPTARTYELEFEITGGSPESKIIQIQVAWNSVVDWAPTLTCLWAEYELVSNAAHRRSWRMTVGARDAAVQRDGGRSARTGRQLAADLWSSWTVGATLAFRDVDYDTTARQYAVRVAGIGEEIPSPADAARWGDSLVSLTLIEL